MNYWEERQIKTQQKLTDKTIEETQNQMKKYYRNSMLKILGQFEETYNKLLLSIDEGREPTPADLYKLDKYWQMQAQLRKELEKLGDKQATLFSKKFEEEYSAIYKAIAIKDDLYYGKVDKKAAEQVKNQIWCADGKSWSQRVWENVDKLQQALNDNLIDCVIAGKKSAELKKLLMNEFDVAFGRADALVKTELAHIQTEAARQRYQDYGITEVKILVSPDERTCPICGKLDGKRFPIGGKMPVPAHPRCRCCITPVVEIKKDAF